MNAPRPQQISKSETEVSQKSSIAIFIYNRPDHLRKTLSSLLKCDGIDDSPITVFGDGPKREDQRADVEAARSVARELLGERADYRFSEVNKGLSTSIIAGVEALLAEHGKVIVLEDDFELAPGFLTFMNTALEQYSDDDQVCQISGYAFAVPEFAELDRALFLPFTTTWGWGTWQRAWEHFDPMATGWEQLAHDPALRKRFNLEGVYDYTTMLQRQMKGQRDSWGIRWYWSVFRRNGITLFPPTSLVRNTGMDETGTHGGGRFRSFDAHKDGFSDKKLEMPSRIEALAGDVTAVRHAIWKQNGGWLGYVIDQAKKIVGRLRPG